MKGSKEMIDTVVVTRHKGLVTYLIEERLVSTDVEVLDHVDHPSQIKGKNVIGILPLSLAIHANTVMDIPLNIPKEMRGKELSAEEVRQYAGPPCTYKLEIVQGQTKEAY